jgi:hypothetical protein
MDEDELQKVARNYKPAERRVQGRKKERWKQNFEAGTGTGLSNTQREAGEKISC